MRLALHGLDGGRVGVKQNRTGDIWTAVRTVCAIIICVMPLIDTATSDNVMSQENRRNRKCDNYLKYRFSCIILETPPLSPSV